MKNAKKINKINGLAKEQGVGIQNLCTGANIVSCEIKKVAHKGLKSIDICRIV